MPEAHDDAARAELARRQSELVRALVAGDPIPDGFDVTRVRIAADALLRKRAGEAAWHIPRIRRALGDRFVPLFVEWARGKERFGSAAEAEAFTAYLVEQGEWEADTGAADSKVIIGRPWWKRLFG